MERAKNNINMAIKLTEELIEIAENPQLTTYQKTYNKIALNTIKECLERALKYAKN